MADGEVRIDVTVDESDAKKGLEDVEDKAKDTGDALEDLGDSSEKAGNGFNLMDVAAGNLIAGGISGLISGIGEVFNSLVSLADETREFREDMAKLETAFKDAGHSTNDAKKIYEDFYAILGESDRSIEAVNHLAELTDNTEELADWQLIAAGVTAKFGDSLPIEGLTEAANETAKVGAVTGPLADALNWAGISEDKFNESLKKCNSEQQRASLITKTLNEVYSAAGTEYNELTAETQQARLATAKMEEAQAALGAKMEPLTTAWTELKARGLEAITPVIGAVSNVLLGLTTNILNNKSATEQRAEAAQETLAATRAEIEAYRELKTEAFEKISGDLAQLEMHKALALELDNLVDANGRVAESDRERAEFLMTTLNEALGLEMQMTGNQIQNYNNLKTSIDAAIASKQAEILLAGDFEEYTVALENYTQKQEEQAQRLIEISEQKRIAEEAEADYQKYLAEYNEKLSQAKTESAYRALKHDADIRDEKKRKMEQEQKSLQKLETAYKENEGLLSEYYSTISSYQEAQSLIMQGKTEEAILLLNNKDKAFLDSSKIVGEVTDEIKKQFEDQAIAAGVNAALMRERYEQGVEGVTEAMVKVAEEQAKKAQTEFEKIGGQIGDGIGEGAEGKKPGLITKIKNIVAAMKNAAKEEADINSPSKEFEWISEMMMDGLSVGLTKNTNQVINDIHNVGRSIIAAMAENSSKVVKNLEDEIKKTTEARDNAYKQEIKKLEKQISDLDDIRTDSNRKTIDEQKKTLQKELKILKEKKEAKQEELAEKKAALQEELNIEKEKEKALLRYADTFEKTMSKFGQLEKDYVDKGIQIFEKLDTDIAAAQNSYDSAFNSRVNSIKSGLGLFNIAEVGEKVKGTELTKALKSQVSVLNQYNSALETLSGKNVNQAFIDELKAMGVDALPQLQAINKMTDKQLTDYVALWEEKNNLATKAATSEMETQRKQTEDEIALLKKNAENDFADIRANYREELFLLVEELSTGLKESGESGLLELGNFVSQYVDMGKELMNGVAEGIETQEAGVISSMVNGIKRALEAAKAEMGIHSPSDVTKDELGGNMALGVGEGWKEKLRNIKSSLSSSLSDTIANLRATVAAETSRFAVAGVPDNGFFDLAQAVGTQTAGINSLASFYRSGGNNQKTIVLKVGEREFGSAVVDLGEAEQSRRGVKMQTKGVSK